MENTLLVYVPMHLIPQNHLTNMILMDRGEIDRQRQTDRQTDRKPELAKSAWMSLAWFSVTHYSNPKFFCLVIFKPFPLSMLLLPRMPVKPCSCLSELVFLSESKVLGVGGRERERKGRRNDCCLNPRFCTARLYWAGDNLG